MADEDKKAAQKPEKPGSTGPMDIPREPGQGRQQTPDELPVGQRSPRNDKERPSRSGGHDVNADRRRSREPYTGAERRTR